MGTKVDSLEFLAISTAVHNKLAEIHSYFVKGVEELAYNDLSDKEIAKGLRKLVKLKERYEEQIYLESSSVMRINKIDICFRCFSIYGQCYKCDKILSQKD